jgi:DNA replication protein DnaC
MEAQVGDPNFGRLIPCECKTEETQTQEMDRLKRLSNMDAFREMTFESYNSRVKGARGIYEAALNYSRDPDGWLLLMGNCGSGKTHLAASIANHALRNMNIRVYFAVVPDLLDFLRATFDPNSGARYDERFDEIKNVPLLVLDDLGTESASPWAREKLYQLINHRYNLKLPTVITTNQDLDSIDPRIRSRITDMALCKLLLFNEVNDYRQTPPEMRERQWRSPGADANYKQTPPPSNSRPGNNRPPSRYK